MMEEANTSSVPVPAKERRRREEAVAFARASVGLEGFKPSVEEEALARRFVQGEISLEEYTASESVAGRSQRR